MDGKDRDMDCKKKKYCKKGYFDVKIRDVDMKWTGVDGNESDVDGTEKKGEDDTEEDVDIKEVGMWISICGVGIKVRMRDMRTSSGGSRDEFPRQE